MNLKFTLEECNLHLEALGKMPYERVFLLVTKFQQQAAGQVNRNGPADVDPADVDPVEEEDDEAE
jgi:hypothetical protein